MRRFAKLGSALTLLLTTSAVAETQGWRDAKNVMDDAVYHDRRVTFFCGCTYISDSDGDGSGDVETGKCGVEPLSENARSFAW